MTKINIFWFRRDLRIDDNTALSAASSSKNPVLPIFIFDTNITDKLPLDDRRINFIYDQLFKLNKVLISNYNSLLNVFKGNPTDIFEKLSSEFEIVSVYANHDYEPYAIQRDKKISESLKNNKTEFLTFKDQVVFEKNEIVKSDGLPYVVYTPYKNRWKAKLKDNINILDEKLIKDNFFRFQESSLKSIESYGFNENDNKIQKYILDSEIINNYRQKRNFPELNATSKIGPYLRFGTISIRKIIKGLLQFEEQTFMDELIWREFFMQILFHFPHTKTKSFKSKYDNIVWLNDIKAFEAWKTGKTGFPIVDAGMRELNNTGFMHNRVRMITASFLCKHLLIDWRWGENYFAQKLNDYEMASNVGNWQWASGSGVDAAPYFRIFNPHTQITKFDKKLNYINKWLKIDSDEYPDEIIEHKFARVRCLETYKKYLD
tara:strand:+ start:1296 stop:2591 length:1296 start_codon:yes stop_codon:yes gene_type:complete